MSNTDDLAEQDSIKQEDLQTKTLTVKPLHRQFSTKLIALLLTIIVALALIFTLFYQQYERSRFLIDGELTPLKQQVEQLQALQKAEHLVSELLLPDRGVNLVELHSELIAVNEQLLGLESLNTHLYQQWLNANKLASDIVMRIQKSHGRNEKLRQSSIIQIQLMWNSITPLIDKKTAQQKLLFKQLKTDQVNDKLTLNRANAYISAIQQLNNLQQLKSLLAEVLTSFEQLSVNTSIENFDLLRLGVKQIFAKGNVLKTSNKTKAIVEINKQIDIFEDIVITKQRGLAKWQGYIRLAKSYQLDLKMQQNQLIKILIKPQGKTTNHVPSMLDYWRDKYNVNLTQEELSKIILLAISLSLLVFCYLLWRLREQIKIAAQQSVILVQESIDAESNDNIQANCAETKEIMQQVKSIAKPVHSEQEFQQLLQQCQTHQQLIDEQAQSSLMHTQNTNQQQLATNEQVAFHLNSELQRYKYLEVRVLSFIQQQQAKLINKPINNETSKAIQLPSLLPVYEQLKQFYLVSDMRSENTVLRLVDVNLVDEIHAVLMNKQAEQEKLNNQLYFSYDEQLLVQAKLDFRLFQQMMYLLIDIALQDGEEAQLHLDLQLKDKSDGQQLVHFVVKVRSETIEALPDLITMLIDSQTTASQESPLVDMFNILFAKQHGENIIANLIDDGFQLSFELPLAIASLPTLKEQQEDKLDTIKVMLLSSNKTLTELLEKLINSVSGQFEVLARIDSFEQQFTAKRLSKHKLNLLIVASDVAKTHMDVVTKQLNCLPTSLQPKLMVLQSSTLSLDDFGFYLQTEQLLFKDVFFQNIKELLASQANTNQLLSSEQCLQSHYLARELPIILAVHSPQKYQNFQRLLHWLGLQVHIVSHADAQSELWQTGLYGILITEFPEIALLEMASKPLVDVAVFSLTDSVPNPENKSYFDDWHIGQLVAQSPLEDLRVVLAPWLQYMKSPNDTESLVLTLPEELIEDDEAVITELVASLAEDSQEAVFDFSQYLHHQGSVELALFMLGDYGQDNHQQLDILIDAIKAKDFDKAKEGVMDLQLNAKILAASELDKLCSQWLKLLSGNDIPNNLKEVNTLLKDTRAALNAIDSYADSI